MDCNVCVCVHVCVNNQQKHMLHTVDMDCNVSVCDHVCINNQQKHATYTQTWTVMSLCVSMCVSTTSRNTCYIQSDMDCNVSLCLGVCVCVLRV